MGARDWADDADGRDRARETSAHSSKTGDPARRPQNSTHHSIPVSLISNSIRSRTTPKSKQRSRNHVTRASLVLHLGRTYLKSQNLFGRFLQKGGREKNSPLIELYGTNYSLD